MNNENLDYQLREWKVEPEVPADFQAGVWAKIASSEADRVNSLWNRYLPRLRSVLIQPAYASLVAVAMVATGLGGAYLQAQQTNGRNLIELRARYTLAIDPQSHSTLRHTP